MNKYVGIKCKRGNEIKLLKSSAGYYLGTSDEYGCPNCRVSSYSGTEGLSVVLRPDRICMENIYCNGGTGCLIKED